MGIRFCQNLGKFTGEDGDSIYQNGRETHVFGHFNSSGLGFVSCVFPQLHLPYNKNASIWQILWGDLRAPHGETMHPLNDYLLVQCILCPLYTYIMVIIWSIRYHMGIIHADILFIRWVKSTWWASPEHPTKQTSDSKPGLALLSHVLGGQVSQNLLLCHGFRLRDILFDAASC